MPQMMPMLWIMLFMFSSLIFFLIIILTFFLFKLNNSLPSMNIFLKNLIWPWKWY